MRRFLQRLRVGLREEDGPTSVEYAIMVAAIILACVATLGMLGTSVNARFEEYSTALEG
ncbi:MAG TPA: Flp family type IVb pilin [Phycisphaerae bacterium]|nr:Flp family type IVb pilin [Phycisphaerae bacterium]HNU43767.1 Flp family type IVb pilin [Phycisphaerae bacterium]